MMINDRLVGERFDTPDFQTPALLLDLDLLERNIAEMQGRAHRAGRLLRPHVKSHKCVSIARLQVEAGAAGLCCATVREVEAMAAAGFDGILLTAPVVTYAAAVRVAAARANVATLMAVVDSDLGIDVLEQAADSGNRIGVLIDIDMGLGRTGLTDPAEAVRLAGRLRKSGTLEYRGLQAYYGHLQHVAGLSDRRLKVMEQWRKLETVVGALREVGHVAEIVSGGGTGTHHLDLTEGPFTEIQAGSYVFMDRQYGAVELTPDGSPFASSLTIASRVVSAARPGRVIVDAGLKAMATDQGPASVAGAAPLSAVYRFMGDEHGALDLPDGETLPPLAGLVRLVPPHCDPTVNLHDRLHVVRDGRLTAIWPIEARGY